MNWRKWNERFSLILGVGQPPERDCEGEKMGWGWGMGKSNE